MVEKLDGMQPDTTINAVTPEVKSFVFVLPELRGNHFAERKSSRDQSRAKDPAIHSPTIATMTETNNDMHVQKQNMLPKPTGTVNEDMYPAGSSTNQSFCERDSADTNPRKRKKEVSTSIRFSDIIGHASVKLRIDELILPLGLPAAISHSILKGIRSIPTSILLYGPPGCGKVRPQLFYTCSVSNKRSLTQLNAFC